jgi:hypothetical protein
MKPTSQTGAAFIAGGSIAGAGISSTVGGIGRLLNGSNGNSILPFLPNYEVQKYP